MCPVTETHRSRVISSESAGQPRHPLDRRTFDAATLMREHPPRWTHPNKRAVFEVAAPPGSVHQGTIGYSRWAAEPLPDRMLPGRDLVTAKAGYLDYEPVLDGTDAVEWHGELRRPGAVRRIRGSAVRAGRVAGRRTSSARRAQGGAGVDRDPAADRRLDWPEARPRHGRGAASECFDRSRSRSWSTTWPLRKRVRGRSARCGQASDAPDRAADRDEPDRDRGALSRSRRLRRANDRERPRDRLYGLFSRGPRVRTHRRRAYPRRHPHRLLGMWRLLAATEP